MHSIARSCNHESGSTIFMVCEREDRNRHNGVAPAYIKDDLNYAVECKILKRNRMNPFGLKLNNVIRKQYWIATTFNGVNQQPLSVNQSIFFF